MSHGLSAQTVERLIGALSRFPQIEKAVIYGSRAKGNYRPGSDLDLTLFGGQLDHALLTAIGNELDDLLLPYKIDLSLFHQLTQPELIEHIQRVGLVLYEKAAAKKEPK